MASRHLDEAKRHPSSLTHVVAAHFNLTYLEYEAAFTEAARALALDPDDPDASVAMAWVMLTTGRPQAALDFMRAAIRLNPRYPSHYALARGLALFSLDQLAEASRVLEEALVRNPSATELAPPLAAIYAHLGRRQEARAMLLRWKPGASQNELDGIVLTYPYTYRWSPEGQKSLDRLDDGMIIAAMPLDITVPGLADALRQGGAFERARTARKLARFGPLAADAVPALVRALEDPSSVVRSAAITALGKIGPKAQAAIPALEGIRDDKLQPLVDNALKEIGDS